MTLISRLAVVWEVGFIMQSSSTLTFSGLTLKALKHDLCLCMNWWGTYVCTNHWWCDKTGKKGSIKFSWKFVTKHIVVMAVVSRALQPAPPHVLSSFGSFTTNHRLNHQSADFVLYVKLVNKQMNLSKVNQTSERNNNEHIRKRTYPSFSFRFKQLAQQRKG